MLTTLQKHFASILIITVLTLLGMRALFHSDLFTGHDIWHQVARLYHYQKALTDGQFPPYWISTLANGLGYPLFFFSYHLPWIAATPLIKLGINIFATLKILFILSFFLSGGLAYVFSYKLLHSRIASLLASILYMWAPYHFLTILVSGALGQAFSYAFAPLPLLGIHLIKEQKRWGVAILCMGIAALILSHAMSLFSLLPFYFLFSVYCFWQTERKQRFLQLLSLGTVLGIGLSAFYLLPATYYSHFTQISTGPLATLYERNFVDLGQLIYSKWGYGIPAYSAKEGAISYQVGISQWIAILVATFFTFWTIAKRKTPHFAFYILLSTFYISIFMMLDYSKPIWGLLQGFITLDYPTMFLLPAVLSASLLSGTLLAKIKSPIVYAFCFMLFVLVIYSNRNHLRVNQYTDFPQDLYIASEITTNSFHEYLPKTADIDIFNRETPILSPDNVQIKRLSQNTNSLKIILDNPIEQEVVVRHFSFPGIILKVNDKDIPYSLNNSGLIKTTLAAGEQKVEVFFQETQLIKLAKMITLFSILAAVIFVKYAKV